MQADIAPPHCKQEKKIFHQSTKAAGRKVLNGKYFGHNIIVFFQPPGSPDLNVLYLGFF